MKVITHRGLDFDGHHPYTESSREAFTHFLNEGFSIEFDIRVTKDSIPVISHDASLARLTGTSQANISDITASDFAGTSLPNGHTLLLTELITLLQEKTDNPSCVHAVHLKHHNQTEAELEVLMPYLSELVKLPTLFFDIKPDVAQKLKQRIPKLSLAASVAHPFDIERYTEAVGGTLIPLEDMAQYTDLYDWVWLDEWDRTGEQDSEKTLYNQETFSYARELGYKIALVSPELHSTSPKLLGGESHQDAHTKDALLARWEEIVTLKPDAICTDYPHTIRKLIS